MTSHCPTCRQPLPTGKARPYCSLCGKHFSKRDRWQMGHDNMPQHLDCANPANPGAQPQPSTQGDLLCPQ